MHPAPITLPFSAVPFSAVPFLLGGPAVRPTMDIPPV